MSSDQPLGYLVKQFDNELNDYVDTALRTEHGVGRAHWQALRTAFGDRKLLLSTFTSEARTFYSDAELAELLSSLTENGWIDVEGATNSERIMVLTDQGEKLLNRMMQTQNRLRPRASPKPTTRPPAPLWIEWRAICTLQALRCCVPCR